MKRSLTVFSLCALFAALALGLALLSGSVYRSVSAASQRNFTRRTALGYLLNKVRAADSLQVEGNSLALYEAVDGTEYVTYVTCTNGWLRETFTDGPSSDVDGTPLLELRGLEIARNDKYITFTVTDLEGNVSSAAIAPRVKEVAP